MQDVSTPGFVLRRYPYKESSLFVDFFTLSHGIVRLLAKGAKRHRQLALKTEPFVEVFIDFNPQYDLPILKKSELGSHLFRLNGEALWCGLYANELLLKLFEPQYADKDLFQGYQEMLFSLSKNESSLALRRFEYLLLTSLGIHFSQSTIQDTLFYCYAPEKGLVTSLKRLANSISGTSLKNILENHWDKNTLHESKPFFSSIIQNLLGEKTLKVKEILGRV